MSNIIGGSRGGVPGARPPMGPNSFVFAYIFTEKCPRRRSTAPLREILDPPLNMTHLEIRHSNALKNSHNFFSLLCGVLILYLNIVTIRIYGHSQIKLTRFDCLIFHKVFRMAQFPETPVTVISNF